MSENKDYLEREKEIHDTWALENDYKLFNPDSFEKGLSLPEFNWLFKDIDFQNKRVLDIGCGLGESSIFFAKKGAHVSAIDISEGVIEKGREKALEEGVKIEFYVTNGEDLSLFEDNTFDYIYAANLLHHLAIDEIIKEVNLKLIKGGSFFSWDPIAYNPVINIYRRLATAVRTIDEHPLTKKDISNICNSFSKSEVKFFWLTGLLIFLKFFLIDFKNPSKIRYWKKIVEEEEKYSSFLKISHNIDQVLFKFLPVLKYLTWNVAIRVTK